MDDQFGGRTDDDLFLDDYEPVEDVQPIEEQPIEEPKTVAPVSNNVEHTVTKTFEKRPPEPSPDASLLTSKVSPSSTATEPTRPLPTPNVPSHPIPPVELEKPYKTLADSRHNPNPPKPPSQPHSGAPPKPPKAAAPSTAPEPEKTQVQSPPIPDGPTDSPARGLQNSKHASGAHPTRRPPQAAGSALETRIQSGANPRTKLTENELAAKMEQMRILSAEKSRKFQKAEQDERQHAEAFARGMEEAERRRANEENRRKMEEERQLNRDRKLNSAAMKQGGGWDAGKQEALAQEEARGFRGSNGAIPGPRNAGLSASRWASTSPERTDDRFAGRGRGRGRGNRGHQHGRRSGGQRDFQPNSPNQHQPPNQPPTAQPPIVNEKEFPDLPTSTAPKDTSNAPAVTKVKSILEPIPFSPVGKWDDEMEAQDALQAQSALP